MSNLIKKLKLLRRKALYGHKATSETYVEHLRSLGIEIGEDCVIFAPEVTHIEENNPHLLTIGDHVAITGPATILCHDYSVGVTKRWSHGDVLGSQKRVAIGNNVFLGWGCTVLAGTTIGDDAVIGAGAVATGNLPGGRYMAATPRGGYAASRSTTSAARPGSSRRRWTCSTPIGSASGRFPRRRCSTSTSTSSRLGWTACPRRSRASWRTRATPRSVCRICGTAGTLARSLHRTGSSLSMREAGVGATDHEAI